MKITCQSCQSKYTVSDEKVQGKTVKIKCRKCGATILVNSGGVTTSAPADPVSLSSGGDGGGASYLVNVAEGDQRSMTLPEIIVAYQSTVVTAETYVWADGMNDWQPLGQVDAIVAALNAPAASAAPATAAVEPEPRAAARRDPGPRGPDLFGSRPAPEDFAAAAAPAPSYGASPSYNGSGSAAARMSASAPAARGGEENSMLFSLSALTAKAAPASSSVSRASTAHDREDSGIIDLKALAAAAASQQAQSSSMASALPDGGLFQLAAPPVMSAAPPVVSPSMPPPKSKAPIFIGMGAVVAVGAIVGVFLLTKGGPPPPALTPAATDSAAASAAPTAEPTASAAPTATAVASAAPTADASATAKAGKGGKGGAVAGKGGGGGPKSGGASPAAAPAAAAPAAAPKKSGGCGCAAGDLMCAMKCSAK
jgi:predicted Zn finger-like uncharacterized protein